MPGPARILLITNIIAPYRIPLLNAFSDRLGDRFSTWFMHETEPDRQWRIEWEAMRFSHRVLPGTTIRFLNTYWHLNPGFAMRLFREHPDVVVMGGYNSLHYPIVMGYTKVTGARLILWNESHFDSSLQNKGMVRLAKRAMVSAAAAFLTPSARAQEYVVAYGADPHACFRMYNCIDPERFRPRGDRRRSYGDLRLLFVGRLTPFKGLGVALDALAGVPGDWTLTVAGTGPEEDRLKAQARALGIADRVDFLGFVPYEAMPDIYSRHNYFMLPTFNDPCPLVVNEALCAGLFCILSRFAGNADEFIADGVNGVTFDPHRVDDVRQTIARAFACRPRESDITASIEKASPESCADVFLEALRFLGVA
jgi:glycosyltransferase involved in cell wall biosynthesis